MLTAVPCTVMRGGSSKGLYFLAADLPTDAAARDRLLLAAMGSPDPRQIDGMGGAHPLTSKVAVVGPSQRDDADVDYLFLQVAVDQAAVSDSQNCGNILAGVGPYAIEQGLVAATDPITRLRIHMVNTGSVAVAHVPTPAGMVTYEGDTRIDGVPGRAAAIRIDFLDVAGSSCGSLLPTGRLVDVVDGVSVTCIDNGMPVVLLNAADFGKTGQETPQQLEADRTLRARLEAIRLQVGPRMNLGDVTDKTVPKMTLLSPARHGGALSTRSFIPHRVHEAIGVLGATSVATACLLDGTVAARVAARVPSATGDRLDIEHPSGYFTVEIALGQGAEGDICVERASLLRTARKLMQGHVFVAGPDRR
jgi:4-oxalomesaconate tautomerase